MMADLIRPEDESRHQLTLSMRERNWGGGGGVGYHNPPSFAGLFSFKETTHNIQVAKTGEHPPFDTVWSPLKN